MSEFQMICDLKDPDDEQGRTFREVAAATGHKIPIGARVATCDKMVLFVTEHIRDCDSTPLYSVGSEGGTTYTRGYAEENLVVMEQADD